MKKLILLLIFPLNLIAGGVDVGNGSSIKVDFHSDSYLSELQLKQSLKDMVGDIKKLKYSELRANFIDAKCEYLNVDKIEHKTKYKVSNNTLIPLKRHQGIIEINVYNCKKPELLILEYAPSRFSKARQGVESFQSMKLLDITKD
ncbi:MAG: hypothetical protein MK008_12470 [Bdellovibrionales bacterium]|nr:hypothetical protein [Bdellovibrionales bacterium]